MKITKTAVDHLPLEESGQTTYWDDDLRGFGVRVGRTGKAYIAQGKIGRRPVRVTLGRHSVLTAEQARKRAKAALADLSRHENPNARKREQRARGVTLAQCFEDYLAARRLHLKPRTVADYLYALDHYFDDWKRTPLSEITPNRVAQRHTRIGAVSPARANFAMRVLRAVFNYAQAAYTDTAGNPVLPFNPARRLSLTRSWYRVERRQTMIRPHELPAWWSAVEGLESKDVRDYLRLVLLTGLRRSEALGLVWADVDLKGRTLTVRDTKNHRDHTLPLSDYLHERLAHRRREVSGAYVFPGPGGDGKRVEVNRQVRKVIVNSGVAFCVHDLRRTFATACEALELPAFVTKRLLNHVSGDVTGGYVIITVERMREAMQRITDYMLKCSGVRPTAEVVALPRAEGGVAAGKGVR